MDLSWCDAACFVSEAASMVSSTLSSGVHLVRVILGGFVLWCVVILTRWLLNNCSFRGRGRRR